MLFSNYGDFKKKDRARPAAKKQDRSIRRLIGMLGHQRKLKTILLVLLVIYLSMNIYYTSRSIIQNEAQIALLKKVLNKPLCVAHEKIIHRLRRLTKDLNYVRMSVDRDVAMARIIDDHSDNLRKLLREIELITSTNVDDERRKRLGEEEPRVSTVVCPEVYRGSIHGYPFYRQGFETEECSLKEDMKEHVTLIFDDVVVTKTTGKTGEVSRFFEFLDSVYRLYPGIRTHFILGKKWNQRSFDAIKDKATSNLYTKASFYYLKESVFSKGELLQNIIDGLNTDYVLIAPSLTHFTDNINLERLLRVLSTRENVLFAGGSSRNLTGHWTNGCFQTQLRNYTLTYKSGYYHSFAECMVCDHLSSPFLAKTSALKVIGFRLTGEYGIYRDLFLRINDQYSRSHPGLGQGGTAVVSCPDVMFHVQSPQAKDEGLADFAKKHEIKKIVEADGRNRWFGCRRGINHRNGEKCPIKSGLAVPPCCLENLADAIKFIMDQCGKNNASCELQEGTLLGAIKLNKVLPWERDADITFLTADFPKLVKIKDVFIRKGYAVNNISKYNVKEPSRPLNLHMERCSFECCKTKAKVITLTNHNGSKQSNEPIKGGANT